MPPRNDRPGVPFATPRLWLDAFRHLRPALELLSRVYDLARGSHADLRDFALDRRLLEAAGLTAETLRWLIDRRLLDVTGGRPVRTPPGSLPPDCRFLLTPAGMRWAEHLLAPSDAGREPGPVTFPRCPVWIAARHVLLCREVVVKAFPARAKCQETILGAFEEEGWPEEIDDPLPPVAESSQKDHLHDVVRRMCCGQAFPVVAFHTTGRGQQVRWNWRQP
jgi:hypothetical protein